MNFWFQLKLRIELRQKLSLIAFFCLLILASVMRTCSDVRVNDCKTVNKVHYCYCPTPLCNGENAESIIEKYGDISDDEDGEDVENENIDSEEASGSDDGDINYSSTSQNIDSVEHSTHGTTLGNKFSASSVSTTSAQPAINKAVNSNLSKTLLNLLTLAYLLDVFYHRTGNN